MTDALTEISEQIEEANRVVLFTSDHAMPEQRKQRAIEHLRARRDAIDRKLRVLEGEG